DGDDLDEHRVADAADVGDAINIAVGQLGDVDHAVLPRQQLDEGAEVLDGHHAPFVDLAELHPGGHPLDAVAALLGAGGRGAGDGDDAGVLDVDLGPRLLLEPPDRLAAGADQHADLLRVDLDLDEPGG